MDQNPSMPNIPPQPLGTGLTLRYALPKDIDKLAELVIRVFSSDAEKSNERFGLWVRDLLSPGYVEAFKTQAMFIEEQATGSMVSALISIPQVWQFSGLPIKVGRPEAVVTDEAFRNRGLVRTLMQEFHRASQTNGDLIQGITGIPWFYRQFGYEMTVELGGGRSAFETQIKAAAKAAKDGRSIRPARREDIPFLHTIYENSTRRYLLSCILKKPWWEYELVHKHPDSITRAAIFVFESAARQPVGFMILSSELESEATGIRYLEIQSGFNWQDYMPLALETAWDFGHKLAAKISEPCSRLSFLLGSQHPAYMAAAEFLPEVGRPYAWYMRVPDLPKLIRQLAPVLEARLEQSPFCAYSGALRISFYKKDLRLEFQSGRLTKAESAPAGDWQKASVRFPDLTFLQLLFGYRSSRELAENFADCSVSEKFIPLMDTLFPKQPSLIYTID